MSIDKSQMKAYAGGVSGGLGVLAGTALSDDLALVITWLSGLVGVETPSDVAKAIAGFVVAIGGFFGGKFITYWFPPNQVDAGAYVETVRKAGE